MFASDAAVWNFHHQSASLPLIYWKKSIYKILVDTESFLLFLESSISKFPSSTWPILFRSLRFSLRVDWFLKVKKVWSWEPTDRRSSDLLWWCSRHRILSHEYLIKANTLSGFPTIFIHATNFNFDEVLVQHLRSLVLKSKWIPRIISVLLNRSRNIVASNRPVYFVRHVNPFNVGGVRLRTKALAKTFVLRCRPGSLVGLTVEERRLWILGAKGVTLRNHLVIPKALWIPMWMMP